MAKYQEDFNLRIGAKDKSKRALDSVAKSVAGITAALVSMKAASAFLKDGIELVLEHEAAYMELAAAVERAGYSWQQAEKPLRAFADRMQSITAISDEVIARNMQLMLSYGMDLPGAMTAMSKAADLAAARQIELKTAVDLLGKAFIGYTGTLSRYGIIVDENISQSEKFQEVLRQLSGPNIAGAAEKAMQSLDKKIALLDQRWGDLKEQMFGVLTAFTPMITGLSDLLHVINEMEGGFNKLAFAIKPFLAALDPTGVKLGEFAAELELANQELKIHQERLVSTLNLYGPPMFEGAKKSAEMTKEAIKALRHEMKLWNEESGGNLRQSFPSDKNAMQVSGMDLRGLALPDQNFSTEWADAYTKVTEDTLAFVNATQAAFATLGSGINEVIWGLEDNWNNVLKRMAMQFTAFITQLIMKKAAISFLSAIPGVGPLLSLTTTAAKASPTSAKIEINFHGDIIGDEEVVRQKIIPQIEAASQRGFSRIALEGSM